MLKKEELQRITETIRGAESRTSGEIRVCVARRCANDPLEAASLKFHKLKMDETRFRNGVLIYVAPGDHKAAIFADTGIMDEVGASHFWDDTLAEMLEYFKQDRISEGICQAVSKVGELIKERYPASENDLNELGDEVIIKD